MGKRKHSKIVRQSPENITQTSRDVCSWNSFQVKRWEYQTTWPTSWEICMQVRKQQLELDMEQQTGSK